VKCFVNRLLDTNRDQRADIMIREVESSAAGRRRGTRAWILLLGVLLATTACSDWVEGNSTLAGGFTSAREERRAEHDSAYARRLHVAARLAQSVKTDSLRKLYLLALDAPPGRVDTVWMAIGCEMAQQMGRVGSSVTKRVLDHLDDSLLALPGIEDRWREMDGRLSGYGTLQGCDLGSGRAVPDSLEYLPKPNVLP
jgi:hypothetical protein